MDLALLIHTEHNGVFRWIEVETDDIPDFGDELEREQYLASMLKRGVSRRYVRTIATYLIHIVRLLKMTSLRRVGLKEVQSAGRKWAVRQSPLIHNRNVPGAPFMFVRVAQSWLRFHGQLLTLPPCRFQREIDEFAESMRIRGLSAATVQGRSYRVLTFLHWFGEPHKSLTSVSLRNIDDFLAFKKRRGWSVTTVATAAGALRSFFRYAELRGWCAPGIALGIPRPQRRRSDNRPKGPTWAEVRKLIKSAGGTSPSDLRAEAIVLLFAIYGLRSSEVAQLRLSDFDWHSETFTVRRAKRDGIQQFPIQYEVGEAPAS